MADFAPQGIYVNGFLYSMSSAEIDVDGKPFRAVNALNYSREMTREDVQGLGALPVGQTRGKAVHTADIELVLHEAFLFIAYLAAKAKEMGAAGPSCVPFNIGVTFDEPNSVGLNTVEILSATYKKDELAMGQGAAGLVKKITLHVTRPILENGEPIINETNASLADVGNVVLQAAASVGV